MTDYQFFDPQAANDFLIQKNKLSVFDQIKTGQNTVLTIFKN
jgi:hypothetical protein